MRLLLAALALATMLVLATAAGAQRPAAPLDTPLSADLDGDGVPETVRVQETACFGPDGETTPPCPAEGLRSIVVEIADTCAGRERVLTISRPMDFMTLAQIADVNGDGLARELVFEARAGASGRGIQAKVMIFRPGAGGCVAVRKTLFSYPQPETVGRAPRGTSSQPGGVRIGDYAKDRPGLELRTTDGYLRRTDGACCPSHLRTTYWRYDRPRGTYRAYRTKLRRTARPKG